MIPAANKLPNIKPKAIFQLDNKVYTFRKIDLKIFILKEVCEKFALKILPIPSGHKKGNIE